MNKKSKIAIIISSLTTVTLIPTVAVIVTSCSTATSHRNIENENQQYANDNSISLGFAFQPNYNYVLNRLLQFFQNDSTLDNLVEISILNSILSQAQQNQNSMSLLFGTCWMIDYKLNNNSNINTYYLATNTHVLDLSYTISTSINAGQFGNYNFDFIFPVNSESVNFLRLFLSQPQGKSNVNLEYNASYNDFETSWYSTNITKNNINSSIIQYANESSNKYDFGMQINQNENKTILVDSNNSKSTIEEQINNSSNNPGLDSSILKLNINPNEISVISKDRTVIKQINKLKRIFDINEEYVDNKSNYISKLKKTYSDLENGIISDYKENNSTFPFELNNPGNSLTVGGFPGDNQNKYTYFNTGTTSEIYYNDSINRPNIKFLNGNSLSYIKYDAIDTSFLGGINLMPGSSGSMVLSNENKIVGIYWGALTNGKYGLFIPFGYKNNSLFTRLTNFIKSSSEFENSAFRKILDFNKN